MKRIALFSVLLSLIVSCAAPSGAVFASSDITESISDSKPVVENEHAASPMPNESLVPVSENNLPTMSPAAAMVVSEEIEQTVATGEDTTLQANTSEQVLSAPVEPAVIVAPEVPLPTSPLLLTAYQASGAHMHALQLFNNSSSMVATNNVELSYAAGGEEYGVTLPEGWLQPRSYMVIAWEGESEYADSTFQFAQVGQGALESITLLHAGYQPQLVPVAASYSGALLQRYKSSAGNYTTNTNFISAGSTISGGGLYRLPSPPHIAVREVLVNPRSCVYPDEATDCYDFIKLRNDGTESIDLSQYRLRSGYANSTSSATNTAYFSVVIAAGETITLTHDKEGKRVSFTANDGTIWLEDVYGFVSFDLGVSPYIGSSLTAQTGRSWAYNDAAGEWQWATPSPLREENDFTLPTSAGRGGAGQLRELTPCRDDQYRSEETNRCRNIATSTGSLTPCREGQYRSEETNRCRSIATAAAAVLKPCADDQFRNPETNRCKKIASSEEVALADCGEGRERNPETNRCRNVRSASTLADTLPFPVEETANDSRYFAGWWTIGSIILLGVGYGIWEWRVELIQYVRRVGAFVTRSK